MFTLGGTALSVLTALSPNYALAEEGRTMLLVTHEMGFARQVSTEVVFLHQGLIEEQGSPEQVFDNPVSMPWPTGTTLKAIATRLNSTLFPSR